MKNKLLEGDYEDRRMVIFDANDIKRKQSFAESIEDLIVKNK
jgi:hypothetical protein